MESEPTWKLTSIFNLNSLAYLDKTKRRAINEGGTSSSKTYSILQLLIWIAQNTKRPLVISVVSESMPHLKRGVMRDFQNIMGDQWEPARWNKSDFTYRWPNCTFEFFSADQPAKLRGGRRDILFINECNNVVYDGYRELDIRTRTFTFLDYNPVSEFWVHDNGLIGKPENAFIHSTYLDAKWVLPPEIVRNIESNRLTDPNWWNIYGLGRIGKVEGLVYPYFTQVDSLPEGGRHVYGLDFGYSNDPSVLLHLVIQGDDLFAHQVLFEAGMTNDVIAHKMDEAGIKREYDEIFADSAEPKSIEEIHRFGFNIKPCPKGADSVEYGHQKINQYRQFWTKTSLDCIKEQRNFRYIPDKDGKLTQKTTHSFSHSMDARRYGLVGAMSAEPTSLEVWS
jgi:phage terminase large subunit